ncbi:MAG TPA: hypothetical protein VK638_18595, partial [Edaphobacter sp.]|nr:hypothetical protein [Edaphobacter sp.]
MHTDLLVVSTVRGHLAAFAEIGVVSQNPREFRVLEVSPSPAGQQHPGFVLLFLTFCCSVESTGGKLWEKRLHAVSLYPVPRTDRGRLRA